MKEGLGRRCGKHLLALSMWEGVDIDTGRCAGAYRPALSLIWFGLEMTIEDRK